MTNIGILTANPIDLFIKSFFYLIEEIIRIIAKDLCNLKKF